MGWNEILLFFGVVAGLATAVRGLIYLGESWHKAVNWFVEHRRARQVMIELASEEGWPNGASGLKQSHQDLYDKISSVQLSVDNLAAGIEMMHPEIRENRLDREGR